LTNDGNDVCKLQMTLCSDGMCMQSSTIPIPHHRHTVDFVDVPFVFAWREMLFDLVYWEREQVLLLLLLLLLNFFHPIS